VRSGRAILAASAVAVVVAASAWVAPEAMSAGQVPGLWDEPSAVVTGAVVRADTVLATPAQTLDRRSRPADRQRVLPPVVVSIPLLLAMAVLWRRPVPIAGNATGRDGGRAVASRAPPTAAFLSALA
jgi:hypothetical protein